AGGPRGVPCFRTRKHALEYQSMAPSALFSGHAARSRLKIAAEDLAASSCPQGLPGGKTNPIGHEPHRSITQADVDAPRVPTAGRHVGSIRAGTAHRVATVADGAVGQHGMRVSP